MARTAVFLGAALGLALFAGNLSGQERSKGSDSRQSQPRVSFGGRGGFTGIGMSGPGAAVMLLAIPEVRTELNLSEEQVGLLDDLRADYTREVQNVIGPQPDFQAFLELSDEERRKRTEEIAAKMLAVAEKAEESIKMVLDEKQVPRLEQLKLQREGTAALLRDDVATKLGLSAEQRTKLDGIQKSGQIDFRSAFQSGQSRDELQKVFADMREKRTKANADMLAVMTADQKTKWDQMQGKKFEFPQMEFGQFGGRGGPGGAPSRKKSD